MELETAATAVDLGCGVGAKIDLWTTTYYQLLKGPNPVLDWLRGTSLLPIQAALGGADGEATAAFEQELGERLATAHPPGPNGTLFPFRRLFFVAA